MHHFLAVTALNADHQIFEDLRCSGSLLRCEKIIGRTADDNRHRIAPMHWQLAYELKFFGTRLRKPSPRLHGFAFDLQSDKFKRPLSIFQNLDEYTHRQRMRVG